MDCSSEKMMASDYRFNASCERRHGAPRDTDRVPVGRGSRRAAVLCPAWFFALLLLLSGVVQGQVAPSAAGAAEFDPKLPWQSSHWAGRNNAHLAVFERDGEHASFSVFEPGRRHVWLRYWQAMPIDAREQYPILVMQYRARGTHPTSGGYVLWLDDGTGPNHGGLRPIRSRDLVTDGQIHEIRRDMREVDEGKISGNLIGMSLGVHCDEEAASASFELIRLAFEADPAVPAIAAPQAVLDEPVRVRVIDPVGVPVVGAQVRIDGDRLDLRQEAQTDSQGQVSIAPRRLAAGEHRLEVSAIDRVTVAHPKVMPGRTLDIVLRESESLAGVVENQAGEPVLGAMVSFWIQDTGDGSSGAGGRMQTPGPVMTDAQGQWRQRGFPAGVETVQVRAHHPDFIQESYAGQFTPAPSMAALRDGTARLILQRGWTLTGVVLGRQGGPVAGAQIGLGEDRFCASPPAVPTDAEGRFRIEHLPHQPQMLTVTARGHGPAQVRTQPTEEPVTIHLTEPHAVRFRVVSAAGEPIQGATVGSDTWRGTRSLLWSGRTDAEGHLTWQDAPPDGIEYYAYAPDTMSMRGEVFEPQEEAHLITLHPPLSIRGRVTDAGTGEPIPSFEILAGIGWENQPEDQIHWESHRTTAGRDGQYEIRFDYPYSRRYLRFQAKGYRPMVSPAFTSEQGAQTLDVPLEPAEDLRGVVLTPEGTPAVGARVFVLEPGQQVRLYDGHLLPHSGAGLVTHPDGAGHFIWPALAPDRLAAWGVVHDSGYAQWHRGEDGAWEQRERIELQAWAGLRGQARVGSQPHTGIQITVNQSDRFGEPAPGRAVIYWNNMLHVDEQGQFAADRLPAGDARVAKLLPMGNRSYRHDRTIRVTLEAGQVLEGIQLGGGGRPVVGRVVFPEQITDRTWSYVHGSLQEEADPKAAELLKSESEALMPEGFATWSREEQMAWHRSDVGLAITSQLQRLHERFSRPSYAVEIHEDGRLEASDIPAGTYELMIQFHASDSAARSGTLRQIGHVQARVEVPAFTDEQMDDPLDIGEVPFVPAQPAE